MARAAVAAAIPDGAENAPKSKKKLLIIAIAAMVVLSAAGGSAWFFLSHGNDAKGQQAAKEEPPAPPVFMAPETFTVNLQPEAGEQYLQVSVVVQVKDQEAADKVKLYMPQIRSRLLMLLSSKKASEITSVDGKTRLSDEIIAQIRQPFSRTDKPLQVTGVHFTDFIIQ